MDPHSYNIAWILSSPDHHAIATSFFDEIHDHYHSAILNATYSTGRVGRHNVVVASKGPATAPRNTGDIVDNLLQEFPSVRAGFLVSVNAVASQTGRARVGDIVVGTRPGLHNGVVYFDAKDTATQKRLIMTREPKHVPENVAVAVEDLFNEEGRSDWLRTLDKGNPQRRRMAYRGLIATSTKVLDDVVLIDRFSDENDIACFDTTAASMNSQSLVVIAGIAAYASINQSYLPSAEVCKVVVSYLSCLTRRISTDTLICEPPLASYYTYKPFDLERPGFRLLSLGKGLKSEPIYCRLFQAYLPEEGNNRTAEVNNHNDLNYIPYEALSYCWGDSTRLRRTVLVDGKVLFVTEHLFDALKSLRRDYEDRILWVDALCIDQSNIRERGHQVGWMGKVYEYADNVLCWLGHVEHTTSHLFSLLQRFKRSVPQVAWENWPPGDLRWSDVWKKVQEGQPIHDYPSQLKRLMTNEWFSRVWVLQEVANARKASIGCSEGWIDTRPFSMAPKLLGVEPDNQCQAIIDIMPGPSRKSSWRAQKSNICTLLWRFRESQASDPRDRLYALLGIASDIEIKDRTITADYTKTEEAVVRDIVAFLFGDKILPDTLSLAKIADLQTSIPSLSALALEKMVLSGAGIDEVRDFMQKHNSMVWLSEAVINYTWCTRSSLMDYFKTGSAFQEVIRGRFSNFWKYGYTTALGTFLAEKNGRVEITRDTMQALLQNGIDPVQLALHPGRDDIRVTEELVKHIAQQGKDSFMLLLDRRGGEVEITRDVIRISGDHGMNVAQLVLSHPQDDIRVTEELVKHIAQQGVDSFMLLLDRRGGDVEITRDVSRILGDHGMDVVQAVLGHPRDDIKIIVDFIEKADQQGLSILQLLLRRRTDRVKVTEGIVKTVATNKRCGMDMMRYLLDRRGEEVKVTEEVVKAAAGNSGSGVDLVEILLDRRGEEVKVTEEVVTAAAGNGGGGVELVKLLLDRRGEEVKVTEEAIKAAAGSSGGGEELMQLLLDRRGEEVKVTEEAVKAAAGNELHGMEIMSYLLDLRGEGVKLTEEVVKAAAGNRGHGTEMMRYLLDRRGKEVKVTRGVVKVAADNKEQEKELMKLLLDRRGEEVKREKFVKAGKFLRSRGGDKEVAKATAGNKWSGKKDMRLLFDQQGLEVKITEEVVKAAAGNEWCGVELMRLLLDRRDEEAKVAEEVAKETAENGEYGEKLLRLLLSGEAQVEVTNGLLK